MKQSEALDMITKIRLAHQAMEAACKRIDELKEENKNLKEALAQSQSDVKQEQRSDSEQISTECVSVSVGEPVATVADLYPFRKRSLGLPKDAPLYTTPQQRKPLTDEQQKDAARWAYIRKHWKTVNFRFNKRPNTLSGFTLTISDKVNNDDAYLLEKEIDDAIEAAHGIKE